MKRVVRYSEAFKLQVIKEVESGRFESANAAREAYGIGGKATVLRWLRQYGKEHLTKRVVRVETTDEKSELKRLREEVRQLKDALAKQSVKRLVEETYFEMLCEHAEVDAHAFKKKHEGVALSVPKKKKGGKR